jgi:6-phosphogluconolactonase
MQPQTQEQQYGGEVIELHVFDDQRAQADALARSVGDALQAALGARAPGAHATLAVSGGSSPRHFLETLSQARFDWPRIDVTLVDDRWVAEDDSDSNAGLVRATLLQQAAQAARFTPLVDITQDPLQHVAALNRAASTDLARRLPDVAVLGMGEDGHTASIFADSPEWPVAITTPDPFVLVHPGGAPHARVSWSLSALKRVDRLFLLIAGERKLDILKRAAADPLKQAISKLANDKGVKLDVYWCA